MNDENSQLEPYVKPELVKHENLKDITLACARWQCSIKVPVSP